MFAHKSKPTIPSIDILILLLVFFIALGIRLGVRLAFGEEFFWRNSYSVYYGLAQDYIANDAVCKSVHEAIEVVGRPCGYLPPLYSLFLALVTQAGSAYVTIVISQAILGAGTVACAYFVAHQMFGRAVAVLTGVLATLYPYYVLHDTALQETGVFTFLAAVSILLLLKVRASNSVFWALLAGLVLGLAVLIRSTFLSFVFLALGWLLYSAFHTLRNRLRTLLWLTLSFAITLSPWLAKSQIVVGGPLMNNHVGLYLWLTNNPYTFSHYPNESMDLSSKAAWNALTPEEGNEIQELSAQGGWALENWFARRAIAYIITYPDLFLKGLLVKVWTAYSWVLSPQKDALFQTVYFISYFPILVLGAVGIFHTHRRWNDFAPIYFLFIAFTLVVAVLFAHTSHRTYLDVYLMMFAAFAIRTFYLNSARWIRQAHLVIRRRFEIVG